MTEISKSYPSSLPTPVTCPWLIFCHEKISECQQTFYNVAEDCYHVKEIVDISGKRICASLHGWMVMQDYSTSDCFLLNSISLEKINLPPSKWNSMSHQFCILSSRPTDDNCFVAFVSADRPCIMFCRPGEREWVEQEFEALGTSDVVDFTVCKGKVYCLDKDYYIVTLELVDDRLEVRYMQVPKAPFKPSPLLPDSFRFQEYLVESCEEIFLVVLSMLGEAAIEIQDIDIYKLDLSISDWVKVESLGDQAFFINAPRNCMSCSATQISGSSIKGNSIYFMGEDDETMCIYDVEEKCIYAYLPCPNAASGCSQSHWVMSTINTST